MLQGRKEIYLVTTGDTLQGVFEDKDLANKFAVFFPGATVDPDWLYTELPKLYKFECKLNIHTGEVIETRGCTPTFDPMLCRIGTDYIIAVGEDEDNAVANAKKYREKFIDDK